MLTKRIFVAPLGVALALGLAASARADSGFALRWFRAPVLTAYSGSERAPSAVEAIVRIAPTMSDANDADQVLAVRGIEVRENDWSDACGVRLVPAYLDPSRRGNVQAVSHDFSECLGRKNEATLADGVVTALQVCTNGRSGENARVKGLRVWGALVDGTARLTPVAQSASFELPTCKTWESRVSCPDGQIATSVGVWATGSIQTMALRCAKLYERAKTPPDQRVTVGEPTWAATTMSVSLTIENSGQHPIGFHGVTLRVRGKSLTCTQAFPNEAMSALNLDEKRSLHLALPCAREDAIGSCDGTRCQATIEWTFAMTSPSASTVTGSQIVTFPKPSTSTYVAAR